MLTFIYFVLFSIWEIWGNYFKVNEWIIFCATVVTTLIGVYATIIAVLISIEYSKNQKKDEQREKLRRINIIVYTEILEYIISVKKSFYEYVWGRECNFESESVNENFKIIIPDIKPEIKDLIYELMIYDTNKNIGTIKNIYDYYIKNKKMIETNYNIEDVNKAKIPDFNLLVGGFPCQDYSVASSLATSKGLEGKKGVLWWSIRETLEVKKPPFVLLENVDRLLKSPAKQRGKDFGVMLSCFRDEGYTVEWRVINAAEYGYQQRRRRIFIFAYKNDTKYAERILM